MDITKLERKLLDAARAAQPSDHVPYAFEKRIMATVVRSAGTELLNFGQALWRAAISSVVVMLACTLWTFSLSKQQDQADFSQEFETAVFVMSDQGDETW